MPFPTLLLTAVGVSADAFAVALGRGLAMRRLEWRWAFAIAAFFGVFQALMPLAGWLLASSFAGFLTAIDHWVAFGLLAAIGGRMLWEAFHAHPDAERRAFGVRELLVLAFATSIDALAVGIGFAFIEVDIVPTVLVIGATTFVFSFVGVLLGHRVGSWLSKPAEIVGGVILIGIGAAVLVDHLTA